MLRKIIYLVLVLTTVIFAAPNSKQNEQLNKIVLMDANNGYESIVLSKHGRVSFSPDGTRIVTAGNDKTAKIWGASDGKELLTLSGHSAWVSSANFSPDGTKVVTSSGDQIAKIWDASSGKELLTLSGHGHYVNSANFSPDGTKIVTSSSDKTAKIWDANNGRLLNTLSGHSAWVSSANFSPDGTKIVTSSGDQTAKIWDANNGRLLNTLSRISSYGGHVGFIFSANFSPDGTKIVTAGSDQTAKIWDISDGKLLGTLIGHIKSVNRANFSPDGTKIVTASDDKTAKIWDTNSGVLLATLSGHVDSILSANFSPDGTKIVTASGDKTTRIWHAKPIYAIASPNMIVFLLKSGDSVVSSSKLSIEKQLGVSLYSNTPFDDIQKLTQAQIDNYLTPRKPIDITSRIPAEIAKPILPAAPTLVKDEFESKAAFAKRVEETMAKREQEIVAMQKKYRDDVEARNIAIEGLKAEYDADIKKIEAEQKAKKEALPKMIEKFAKLSLLFVMDMAKINDAKYDAETGTMYVDVAATGANYAKKVALKLEPNEARAFKTDLFLQEPIIEFDYKGGAISLKAIKFGSNIGGIKKEYMATLTDSDFRPETVKVALSDKKVEFDSTAQAKLTLQNPNLTDKYQVQAMGYYESNSAKGLKYNDDLTPLVNKLQSVKSDGKKWLFAVAVEKYDEADPVIYASNSAKAFVAAAQKKLGIDERHTYKYIDDRATAGSIKDNLTRMLENVKDGDTIYFYYSGHGIPSSADGEAYILPKDKIADYITREKEFMARQIYRQLSGSKAAKVIAFVDSCYSGRTDGVANIKGVAAGVFKTKKVDFDTTKMVVLTAGTSGQFSNAYPQKGHRLFTYYLTKALVERPTLDIESLYQEVALRVKDESFKMGDNKKQEPQIEGNLKLAL